MAHGRFEREKTLGRQEWRDTHDEFAWGSISVIITLGICDSIALERLSVYLKDYLAHRRAATALLGVLHDHALFVSGLVWA